ncbi:VirK/YbjX family protein [Noviherbaspirillum agri]
MVTTRRPSADPTLLHTGLKRYLTLLSGALLHPVRTCRMLYFINTQPALCDMPGVRANLLAKIHAPYLSSALDANARIELLQRHYDIAQKAGFGKLMQQAAIHRLILCAFTGKSGMRYRMELSTAGDHHRAGEWVLRLVCKDTCVYTVTFLFAGERNDKHILIGNLTGMLKLGQHAVHRMGIIQATWDLYGWQPRQMMVSLVQEIGAFLGCRKVVLIGNRNKLPATDARYCRRTADYDRFWKQLNATVRPDGNFELPCPSLTPDSLTKSSLPAWTKRRAMIDSIHHTLRMRLADERAWPATVVQLPQFDELERKSA